ncbi:carboxylesterase [Buchnera aphidicola (Cinara tujafilina)]|uniref:Carboxylesterase n=1 Tax=Buchnera aphidicola (Cinara tujafilina) TaxID=261317 RepID=F7WZQ5_9GAMM|nr:alpha/beta fold hydrolase [Buchnera aphidicola]AEH39931.1 carboxylesterase [Buchnera aphidicola (Cinara tujafilina)]
MYIKKYYSIIKTKTNLVFLHGWGLDSNIWTYMIPILKLYYNLYFIDLPGFGSNIKEPILNFKKLSIKILEQLPKKIIWIGWSMGGLIITYISLHYPKRTDGIILINSSPFFLKKNDWFGINILVLKKIEKKCIKIMIIFKKFYLLHIKTKKSNLINVLNFNQIKKFFCKPTKNAIQYGYICLTTIDQRKKLNHLQVPLLQIYGSLDNMVPVTNIKNLGQLYSKYFFYIIQNSKHAPFFSHVNELCCIIMKFIKYIS